MDLEILNLDTRGTRTPDHVRAIEALVRDVAAGRTPDVTGLPSGRIAITALQSTKQTITADDMWQTVGRDALWAITIDQGVIELARVDVSGHARGWAKGPLPTA